MQEFTKHIKEAIQLNSSRLEKYAQLTDNKSVKYSMRLIKYEKLILLSAPLVDLIGDRFQKKGLPFISEEFVDMNLVKDFSPTFPESINYQQKLRKLDFSVYLKPLKAAYTRRSYADVLQFSQLLLVELQSQAHVYCMTRHIIESIHRIAFLIPLHQEKSKILGIKGPEFYSWILINSHLKLVKLSVNFDEELAFIQESGVPFIWQDLPSINTINSYTVSNTSN